MPLGGEVGKTVILIEAYWYAREFRIPSNTDKPRETKVVHCTRKKHKVHRTLVTKVRSLTGECVQVWAVLILFALLEHHLTIRYHVDFDGGTGLRTVNALLAGTARAQPRLDVGVLQTNATPDTEHI